MIITVGKGGFKMRPLRLEITAFGPFAGQEILDFGELGERSFFLIHGPTGSGKTTVLDAMCFALYGDTSGAERTGEQMCCTFAGEDHLTRVVFDFSLGEKKYRVSRHPQQQRRKKRGEGFTLEQPGAELLELNKAEVPGASTRVLGEGWNKVTTQVESILGFRSDQFRQVVMLPQGKFRQLLTADSREREDILRVLFQTERYSRIEAYLKEKAKSLEEEIKCLEQERTMLLQQEEVESSLELQEKLEDLEKHLHALSGAIARSETLLKTAQKELAEGESARLKLADFRNAQLELAALEKNKEEMRQLKQERERGILALSIQSQEDLVEATRKKYREAQEEFIQCVEGEKKARVALEAAQVKMKEIREKVPEQKNLTDRLAVLKELMPKVASLEEIAQALEASREREKETAREEAKLKHEWEDLKGLRQEKLRILEETKKIADRLEILAHRQEEAKNKYEKRQTLDLARKKAGELKEEYALEEGKTRAQEAKYELLKNQLDDLRSLWQSGQAALLAGTLDEGQPCPVCGSLEHPAPALSMREIPSEKDLKKIQKDTEKEEKILRKQREKQDQIKLSWAQAEEQVRDLEESFGAEKDLPLDTLKEDWENWAELLLEAQTKVATLPKLEQESDMLLKDEEEKKSFYEALLEKWSEDKSKVIQIQASLKEREAGIPENLRQESALQEAIEKTDQALHALEKHMAEAENQVLLGEKNLAQAQTALYLAKRNCDRYEDESRRVEEALAQKIREAGFSDFTQYRDAKRGEKDLKEYEEKLQNFESALKSALDWIERAGKAALGLQEPDLEGLTQALQQAQNLHGKLNREKGQLDMNLKTARKRAEEIIKIEGQLQVLEPQYQVLGHVAQVANGRNPLGMTFQRFVLGALLDDVAIAANERLKGMSRGRYLLSRTLDRERANAAGGLELEVMDNYTGLSRKAVTLSGGESFLASLALALGLAEVVQSYAGGVHLDTIFIDEGFGSLDPDALDDALGILMDLQKNGRLIGIISHIPELKERIDARLEIKSGVRGSTARFVLA
jgi:exonuclease SbcC